MKPASADCNLRCEYCFYLEKSALYPEGAHRMSDEVLERLVSGYMATDQPVYAFGWQGGEPTLMGVDFFRRVTELQQKHGRPGSTVSNGLQTNATLIDDDLAGHLSRYNFLLGVSIDGPEGMHDRYRRNAAGSGSHTSVLRGVECLRWHGVKFNALALVNSLNARHGGEVYRYLRDTGIGYHQYIPCVEFGREYSVDGESWGEFLCEVFDEWYAKDTRNVSVRLFDTLLALLVDDARNACHIGDDCRQYFLVEHNGDVYPCDFFVEPALKLGNVMTHTWAEMQASEAYRVFGARKKEWSEACAGCEYRSYCMGDCPKHRAQGLSVLCSGWKRFFRHALPRLEEPIPTLYLAVYPPSTGMFVPVM
ncbi:MAG: anaerobic sulfatase maturase [Armatimonadota bacterium]